MDEVDGSRAAGQAQDWAATCRRRVAALRCEPLADGRRDPDWDPGVPAVAVLDGWAAAIEHLRRSGFDVLELVDIDVRRALWASPRHRAVLWPGGVAA